MKGKKKKGWKEGRDAERKVYVNFSLTGCVSHTLRCPTINHALV